MTQTARPTGDKTVNDWITAPLWSKINDASDATYIDSGDAAIQYCEVYLGDMSVPGTGTVTLSVRAAKWDPQGDMYAQLVEDPDGTPVVRATMPNKNLTASFFTYTYDLTAGEVASITDWSNLSVRLWQNIANRVIGVADVWLTAPDSSISADAGTVVVTGAPMTPDVSSSGESIDVSGGTVAVTGADMTPSLTLVTLGTIATIAVTGADVGFGVVGNHSLDAAGGTVVVTGAAADLVPPVANESLDASEGTVTVAGADASLLANRVVSADAGAVAVTGADMTPSLTLVQTGTVGVANVTGADVSFDVGVGLAAAAGIVTVSGADVALEADVVMQAAAGTVTVTGADADLGVTAGASLDAAAGTVAVTGYDTNETFTEEAGPVDIIVVTGASVSFGVDYSLDAAEGTVDVDGAVATLGEQEFLLAATGTVAVVGAVAELIHSPVLAANAGTIAVTGADVDLVGSASLDADAGTIAVIGAPMAVDIELRVTEGTILVTGAPITTIGDFALAAEAGAISVLGGEIVQDFAIDAPSGRTDQIFADPDFDDPSKWNPLGTGISITGGQCVLVNPVGTLNGTLPPTLFGVGKKYHWRMVVDESSISGSLCNLTIGGVAVRSIGQFSVGVHEGIVTAVGTSSAVIVASASGTLKIGSIEVREITSGELAVTGASVTFAQDIYYLAADAGLVLVTGAEASPGGGGCRTGTRIGIGIGVDLPQVGSG